MRDVCESQPLGKQNLSWVWADQLPPQCSAWLSLYWVGELLCLLEIYLVLWLIPPTVNCLSHARFTRKPTLSLIHTQYISFSSSSFLSKVNISARGVSIPTLILSSNSDKNHSNTGSTIPGGMVSLLIPAHMLSLRPVLAR